MKGTTQAYRYLDAAVLRTATYTPAVPAWPSDAAGDAPGAWLAWAQAVWADNRVADAVRLASPALASGIEGPDPQRSSQPGRDRDLALSLARYVIRMRGRATPFGLFAGVSPLRFTGTTSVDQACERVQVQADARWLADVITRLEAIPELLGRLSVTVSNLAFVRGDRLVVPWQPGARDGTRTTEVSVRCSSAVQLVLAATTTPRPLAEVSCLLADAFPGSPGEAASLLARLIAHGVLISNLRPASTAAGGLAHLVGQLRSIGAATIPAAAPVEENLRGIHAQLNGMKAPAQLTRPAVERVVRAMDSPAPVTGTPLMVTSRSGMRVTLPPAVAAEAASAAGVLARLSPDPAGDPAWQDYYDRFYERYGAGAVVPLSDLTDPVGGIGFPAHFHQAIGAGSHRPASQRDLRLLALAQQSALDGALEVVLSDALIDRIVGDPGEQPQYAPHAELCTDLRAPSRAAIDDGAFQLGLCGGSRSALAMAGRFISLHPAGDQRRMREEYRRLPAMTDGALLVQLSFPPVSGRLENVARAPAVLPAVLSLAEYPDGAHEQILLPDLAVTSDSRGLHAVSLSRRRVIEVVRANAVAPAGMPLIARLLAGLALACSTGVQPFSWGIASGLPFLPRLRYGRAILAPAMWRLPPGQVPDKHAPAPEWLAAFGTLRSRLGLPGHVRIAAGDRLLTLDLGEPMDLAVLRAHLDGEPDAVLSEAPAPADYGWLGGRAHEIVIPVAATAPPGPAPAAAGSTRIRVASNRDGCLPGSPILYARLYARPELFDTILTTHLDELLAAWDQAPPWWFVRYRDTRPHLRLRLHLAGPGGYGDAAGKVGQWAAALRQRGLVSDLSLDTYRPETARYGDGEMLAAAEALFAADSAAAVTQLAVHDPADQPALAAVSLADLTAALAGSCQAGMGWLIGQAPARHRTAGDRDVIRRAVAMAGTGDGDGIRLDAIPGAAAITAAWQARRQAAARYAGLLAMPAAPVDPDAAITALLHMHHNRVHGITRECEPQCRQAARAIALAWTARHSSQDQNP